MTSDDDQWLDALAGREQPPLTNSAHEGRVLRAFLQTAGEPDLLSTDLLSTSPQSAGASNNAPVPTIDVARENDLVAYARAAGLLPAQQAPTRPSMPDARAAPTHWWRSLFVPRVALISVTVVIIAIGIGRTFYNAPPMTDAYRGAEHHVVRLEANEPLALQQQLRDELASVGVHVTLYQQLGRAGLDADLVLPVSAAVKVVLARHRIPMPADGALVIEIDTPRLP